MRMVGRELPRILVTRLAGLRVAVDLQHICRPAKPCDRGAVFTFKDGLKHSEAGLAVAYGQAIVGWLRARGALVFTTDPTSGILCGPYSHRNTEANGYDVHAYLACHVNAGGGSYGAVEALNGTNGVGLAATIVHQLVADFAELRTSRVVRLNPRERGGVCIRGLAPTRAAVLLEPAFGDCPAHQAGLLADPRRLQRLGESLAAGVAAWWEA